MAKSSKEPWAGHDALRSGADGGPVTAQAASSEGTFTGGGGYHGADSSTARTTFLGFPTNSLTETARQTRVPMVQKVRALEANLPIVGRIKSKIGQHSVGKGIFAQPATQDKEWNALAKSLFEEWAGNPDVYSIDASRDHYQDQRLVAEGMVLDGEYFAALVKSENGAPMIQAFDPFEIESPMFGTDSKKLWVDGVRPNAFMRPVAYSVRELQAPGSYQVKGFREIPKQDMLHVFDRMRVKQMRGITWFHAGINQGIDILDLRALMTGSAKLHESMAVTVTKSAKVGRNGAVGKVQALGDGVQSDDDFKALEKVYGGGMISYLGKEGEVKLLTSDRPSQNILEFQKYLAADIASATRLPFQIVMSMADLGGATARAAMEDAQWLFEMIQDRIIWSHSFPIYRWRIAKFMQEGRLPKCKDPFWWVCSWRGPAKLTVDIGRTADANVKLLKNGMLSLPRYYDERGLDAWSEIKEQVDFRARVQAYCEEAGVNINSILEPTPGAVTQINMPEPPAQ